MQLPAVHRESLNPGSATIFVAEDDPHLKELTGMLLESAGLSFLAFDSGEAALEAFRKAQLKPRLVISDFSMGARLINGVQFLAECKRLCPETKAFLVSGTVEEKDIRVDGQPVDCFMSKPFKAEEFLNAVRRLLAQSVESSEPPTPRL